MHSKNYDRRYYTLIDWVLGQQQPPLYGRNITKRRKTLYNQSINQWTTAVLFDPTDGSVARGLGQQILSRGKLNCCCPRNHSITDLLYTFIFRNRLLLLDVWKILMMLSIQQSEILDNGIIDHCADVKITWLVEPMKIRQSVNSSIAGNKSTNCWPVKRTVMQRIGIFL